MTAPEHSPAVTLVVRGLSKRFGPVRALDGIDLEFPGGQVTALMGENGAGKSTLLKMLGGDFPPDDGVIELNGNPVRFGDPAAARRAGLRIIAQEPEIIPHVSVAENIYAGAIGRRGLLFRDGALRGEARRELERYGFSRFVDPDQVGSRISPAGRQLVEIMRALVDEPRVLCFDEPTSSLSEHEIVALFNVIRRLRDRGHAIVYVSHRMQEIFRIADRVAVLRDGRLVGVRTTGETDEEDLVRMMVGRDLTDMFHRDPVPVGEVVLRVDDVCTDAVQHVSFDVRAGEVVALAGLVGAGRTELVQAVVGDVPLTSGQVIVDGTPVRLRSPRDSIRAGVGFAPEERKQDALILERTIRDNVVVAVLNRLTRMFFVNERRERATAREYTERLRIRAPSIETLVKNLSGGNQQKVVLARWLARQPKVLILDEPTRGVDVGAKAEIYAIIAELARSGRAMLVISSELPEVLGLADRILVMEHGHLTGELTRREATEEKVLALAMADQMTEGRQ